MRACASPRARLAATFFLWLTTGVFRGHRSETIFGADGIERFRVDGAAVDIHGDERCRPVYPAVCFPPFPSPLRLLSYFSSFSTGRALLYVTSIATMYAVLAASREIKKSVCRVVYVHIRPDVVCPCLVRFYVSARGG